MQTKWTALGVLTLLIVIILIPLASQGDGGGLWMWLPEPITPAAHDIGWIFDLVLVVTGILFIDIHAIMIYYVIRYRERDLQEAEEQNYALLESLFSLLSSVALVGCGYYLFAERLGGSFWTWAIGFFVIHTLLFYLLIQEDEFFGERTSGVHGHLGVEITWTIIPTIIMILLGIYTFEIYSGITKPLEDATHVQVTGQQFAWQTEYDDGTDITMNNRVVLPADRPIQLHLNSPDVLHSFYVPSFRMKQDLVPGQETHMFIEQINRTGTFNITCAELCGLGHYRMKATLYVLEPEVFDQFLSHESRGERVDFLKKVIANE